LINRWIVEVRAKTAKKVVRERCGADPGCGPDRESQSVPAKKQQQQWKRAGLWVRVHWSPDPDRDPALIVNPDPDPNQGPDLNTNWIKFRVQIRTQIGSGLRRGAGSGSGSGFEWIRIHRPGILL
jgi:hypothetical protein